MVTHEFYHFEWHIIHQTYIHKFCKSSTMSLCVRPIFQQAPSHQSQDIKTIGLGSETVRNLCSCWLFWQFIRKTNIHFRPRQTWFSGVSGLGAPQVLGRAYKHNIVLSIQTNFKALNRKILKLAWLTSLKGFCLLWKRYTGLNWQGALESETVSKTVLWLHFWIFFKNWLKTRSKTLPFEQH